MNGKCQKTLTTTVRYIPYWNAIEKKNKQKTIFTNAKHAGNDKEFW